MIHHGDLFDVLPTLPEASVDACVTDPPYGIGFMGKQWDTFRPGVNDERVTQNKNITSDHPNLKGRKRSPGTSASGVEYDRSLQGQREFQDWCERWAREVFRILKPGAHLVVFGAPRSFHRMTSGIEDAGFEIRDCLSWLFGQGFPKSLNLGDGRGTALKPAWEPAVLARKPLSGTVAATVAEFGTGTINIDSARIGTDVVGGGGGGGGFGESWANGSGLAKDYEPCPVIGRWPANVCLDEWHEQVMYLKYNVPTDAASVIREYFSDYTLPSVPTKDRDFPEPSQKEKSAVLLQTVLCEASEQDEARRESSDVRAQALAGIAGEDAGTETGDGKNRRGESQLEGPLLNQGLRDDLSAGSQGRAGTPPSHGVDLGASVAQVGSSPSSERNQERQPAGESRATGQRHAQAIASGHRPRTESTPARVRTLEVLKSDVPALWRQYFTDTGLVVRRGAAAMLDEQSGELQSGTAVGGLHRNSNKTATVYGHFKGERTEGDVCYGDSGGASRFFYVAKPSRAEREEGIYDIEPRQRDDSRKDGNPGGDNPRNRGLSKRGNFHPTVKPVELMRWLVRLVTPVGGTVLDPFMGSGTTGMACAYELRPFIGIEREADYIQIAERRIASCVPLFAGAATGEAAT